MQGGDEAQNILTVVYPITDLCGDPLQAAQLHERVIKENPGNAISWVSYGYSLAATGKIEEAFAVLDKAEQLDPDALWIRYMLAPFRAWVHMLNDDWEHGVQIA